MQVNKNDIWRCEAQSKDKKRRAVFTWSPWKSVITSCTLTLLSLLSPSISFTFVKYLARNMAIPSIAIPKKRTPIMAIKNLPRLCSVHCGKSKLMHGASGFPLRVKRKPSMYMVMPPPMRVEQKGLLSFTSTYSLKLVSWWSWFMLMFTS